MYMFHAAALGLIAIFSLFRLAVSPYEYFTVTQAFKFSVFSFKKEGYNNNIDIIARERLAMGPMGRLKRTCSQ